MSKEEFIQILETAFAEGNAFINHTKHYSYALIPKGDKWLEISYDFEDKEIFDRNEISGAKAYINLCEEIEKAMSEELEVFYLNRWQEFKAGLKGTEGENLKASINELISNHATYSDNLPLVLNQEDIKKILDKL
jgi:hypothetical protein